uniref:G_PROTEIN_RECEP_F1_2 domain-containing protein n=1 Tax=Steinernema glaseri TaxID=37863 RepID=A0A1I8AWW8_9BILA
MSCLHSKRIASIGASTGYRYPLALFQVHNCLEATVDVLLLIESALHPLAPFIGAFIKSLIVPRIAYSALYIYPLRVLPRLISTTELCSDVLTRMPSCERPFTSKASLPGIPIFLMLSVRDQLIFFIVEGWSPKRSITHSLGVFVLVVNVPTVIIIYLVSRLRRSKDLIVLGGLCCADISHSMGFLTAGIMRIHWMDNGQGNEITAQRNCYFYPFIVMFFIGYQFTGLMTMVVSLDRLFAVTFPIKHVSRQIKHYIYAIGLVLAYCVTGYFVAMPFQLQSQQPVSAMCYTSTGFIRPLWNYLLSFRIVTVGVSVAVYVPIALKTRKIMDSTLAATGAHDSQKQKIARLNLTIGMTSISALLLLFIPDILILFNIGGLAKYEVIFYIVVLNKCVVNVFIYTFRHRELRTAFTKPLQTLLGKTLLNSVVVGSTDLAQHAKVTAVRRMENLRSVSG